MLLKQASQLFKAGKYEEAYRLYKQAEVRYGKAIITFNLDKCKKHLNDEIIASIDNSLTEVKLQTVITSTVVQKEFTQDLIQADTKISLFSEKISAVPSISEFDYLLEYASELRKIEMSETYVKLIKYILVQYEYLNDKNKKNMELHLANVIKLSEDEEVIDLLINKNFELFKRLPLSPKTIDSLLGTDISNMTNYGTHKYMFFDLQSEAKKAVSYVFLENSENLKKLNPEYNLLYCNLYAQSTIKNTNKYVSFLNKYLSHSGLVNIKSINLHHTNVLSEIEFETHRKSTNSNHLVSIIMSAFQAEETIEYAIKSLLLQTHENIEILVCDDGSTDETLQILENLSRSDKRIKLFKSKRNQGTYNIRNDMIKEAKGEYITFQDSDDYAFPNRIELQLDALNKENTVMCCTRWIRIKPSGEFVFFHDDIASRFCVVSSMVKKDIFSKIPKFRESLVAADTEFYQAVITTFGKEHINILNFPLILGLWGDGSLTKKANLAAENTGFVAQRRRTYSDIAARQRELGKNIISDEDVINVLKENNIYMEHASVKKFNKGEWK